MERFEDRERLAPVTYLPGVIAPEPDTASQPVASAAIASNRSTPLARPTFAAVYGANVADTDTHDDDPHNAEPAGAEPSDDIEPARDRDGELHRAENVSMHALTRRGQSRREIERILRARDLPDDVVTHEVERLERVGLVDDVALAQNLVGVLQERKGLGRSGISAELARRLLSPAAIEYALELIDTADELGRARELAIKRAGQLTSYDHATAQRRLSAYLARRGYSGSTVRAAVDDALSSRHAPKGVRFR